MTAPTAAKKTAAAKSAETKAVENEGVDPRIPESLASQTVLSGFMERYLSVFDEVTEYNKIVLAEKNSEWNASKVLAEARKMASPEDPKDINPEVKKALEEFERVTAEQAKARNAVLEMTSKVLGISLSAVANRDPAAEAPLKEKRKIAVTIGTNLSAIAEITTDETAKDAVKAFLTEFELPSVGRDQTRSFTDGGTGTPKHRVTVEVKKGDKVLAEGGSFSTTAILLTKPEFGYERGKALKSDDLRNAWEKSGNTTGNVVVDPVEFEDNGLSYTIRSKK